MIFVEEVQLIVGTGVGDQIQDSGVALVLLVEAEFG